MPRGPARREARALPHPRGGPRPDPGQHRARPTACARSDVAEANTCRLDQPAGRGDRADHPHRPPARRGRPLATASPAARPPLPPEADGLDKAVRVSYRIKPGDTLAAIASQYGTTVRDLQSWNGLRGSRIAAGDTLTIYTSRKF